MEHINFFSHERFSERLVIFTEGYSMVHRFTIGCVIGDEKILVIDAGLGMSGDLRTYIESVVGSGKPMICACTHGHLDHVGSACQFDEAYCSLLDLQGPSDPFDPIRRYCDVIDFGLESKIVMDYCRKHMIEDNRCVFKDIRDGDVFDLGGVKLEAIAIPGHSRGSMAFYNREENYCFTGDGINTDTHLKHLDNEGFRQYKATMERFISLVDENVTLYPAHLPLPMTIDVAKNLVQICDDIANGRIEHDPPCDGIFHGRKNNRSIRGHYYENTCAVYDRGLLKESAIPMDYDSVCYYSHERWSERVYTVTINHSTVNRITLMIFIGDEKILVIDSGHGIDNRLRTYIEGFAGSGKPMLLACTHVGIDHAGGAPLFDEVYLHPADIKKLPLSRNKRLVDVQPFSNYNKEFEEYTSEHMLEAFDSALCLPIYDGDVFDLGGIQVECILTPGHSEGHMAFYCPAEKLVFTGDAMNADTHLKALDKAGMLAYAEMLERFMARVEPEVKVFSSHLNRPHGMRVPRNIQQACREIAEGKTAGDPPAEAIQQHISAFHDPWLKMHYHGNSCVVYNSKLMLDAAL